MTIENIRNYSGSPTMEPQFTGECISSPPECKQENEIIPAVPGRRSLFENGNHHVNWKSKTMEL
jgi:hypothetical protein